MENKVIEHDLVGLFFVKVCVRSFSWACLALAADAARVAEVGSVLHCKVLCVVLPYVVSSTLMMRSLLADSELCFFMRLL